jgi:hypothetical protein
VYKPDHLCYYPIPSGFTLDTVIFAPAWWILLSIPALRRARRRHRNLCPHCAYNRQGLPSDAPCPECGRAPT